MILKSCKRLHFLLDKRVEKMVNLPVVKAQFVFMGFLTIAVWEGIVPRVKFQDTDSALLECECDKGFDTVLQFKKNLFGRR